MVVLLKNDFNQQQLNYLVRWLESLNLEVHMTKGQRQTILGLVGDTSKIDMDLIRALDIVENVTRIQEPYKNASKRFHPEPSMFDLGGTQIGAGMFQMIAGPCSIESEEQLCTIAEAVKQAGATMLRGGAYKPRTSPYSFQGLQEQGISLLVQAKRMTGLPIVTEIMDLSQLPYFDDVDVIQVGARNMQNFTLLRELGHCKKPILLKRGLSSTLQEWLMSAEYILSGGNERVILCERGIRTFETYTRNTLDLSAVPALKELTHLPVIVDPSHATGIAKLIPPMALAAVAAGADGLMLEVHNDPAHALCDGPQSLTPETFCTLAKEVGTLRQCLNAIQEENQQQEGACL